MQLLPPHKFSILLWLLLFCFLGHILPKLFAASAAQFPIETQIHVPSSSNNGQNAHRDEKASSSLVNKYGCAVRRFADTDSFVCVCNATFCDRPEPVGQLEAGKAVLFLSDAAQHRLSRSEISMGKLARGGRKSNASANVPLHIRVDASRQRQTILGFGAAFTDAAGLVLNQLPNEKTRQNLLNAYFDQEIGIGYSLGRVPIASCDFSTRVYSYCDTVGDFQLKTFSLAKEDFAFKIPVIHAANWSSGGRLRLFASPWSAPAWMKSTGRMAGGGTLRGTLKGPFYESYAHYFRRFFEEYARANISFWGLTLENEPQYGRDPEYLFQAMWLSPEMQRDFANQVLAPVLRKSSASEHILIMGHDDSRDYIYDAAVKIFNQTSTMERESSIAGLAYHWYDLYQHSELDRVHSRFPDRFLLSTEVGNGNACTGWTGNDRGVSLGNWTRAWMYGRDIVRSLQNWGVGWTDWNLGLDTGGGPNWVKNFVDSPVIANASADEFYKQPMFYAMAHFSRFIPPGSVQINSKLASSPFQSESAIVEFVAFRTPPDGHRVLVFVSNADAPVDVLVEEEGTEEAAAAAARIQLPANSIGTLIWAKQK